MSVWLETDETDEKNFISCDISYYKSNINTRHDSYFTNWLLHPLAFFDEYVAQYISREEYINNIAEMDATLEGKEILDKKRDELMSQSKQQNHINRRGFTETVRYNDFRFSENHSKKINKSRNFFAEANGELELANFEENPYLNNLAPIPLTHNANMNIIANPLLRQKLGSLSIDETIKKSPLTDEMIKIITTTPSKSLNDIWLYYYAIGVIMKLRE